MEINIGMNIKRLRTTKNITQEQLSAAMNVSCAAVSKWERGETYPDITLLQPLAFFFGVSLDDLMGYNEEKVKAEISEVIAFYRKHCNDGEGRDIIIKAYGNYPNDFWIMHYYMWELAGDLSDNDPSVLLANKEEFLSICEKILNGCMEEKLRFSAWNMRAKILHAEGNTGEALEIYKTKFTDWYTTGEQKTEQLFAKDTAEYVQKNMYELADFTADKLGRTVFFSPSHTMKEKSNLARAIGEALINSYNETSEAFFLILAKSFLGRIENDLLYRGGSEDQVIGAMDQYLSAIKLFEKEKAKNPSLFSAFARCEDEKQENFFLWLLNSYRYPKSGRRADLLKNPNYMSILDKYK